MSVEALVFVVRTHRYAESLAFYREVMGLGLIEEWTDFGHGAVLSAGDVARVELIDDPSTDDSGAEAGAFLGLQVTNVDEVHARAIAAGTNIVAALQDRPWGGRGFAVRDPNGIGVNVYTSYDQLAGGDH